MKVRLPPTHVRTRLTLWYVGVLAGVLLLYAGSSLAVLFLSLRHGLDRTLRADFERVEDLLSESPDGAVRMGGHEGEADEDTLVEVRSLEGAVLYRRPEGGDSLPPPTSASAEWSFSSVALADGTVLRVLSHAHRLSTRSVLVRIAASEAPLRAEWRELGLGLSLGLPVAIAVAGLGGHWLARRVLSPLDRMARTAEELTAENLGRRLPVENPDDELGHLARAFNASLARIEESFARLRRFTADVSHELRTPLTAIRSVGEVGLAENPAAKDYREIIGSILEEADRLTLMVDTLLALSRADAGEVRLNVDDLDLVALARDVAAHLGVLAEERDQTLEVEASGSVWVKADHLVLRQALVNVVDNAIKYSPRGTPIRMVVAGDAAEARIEVVDKGPGIAPEHRERIFERFYRIDPSRSRDQGGAGLGLSLAHWAVTVHGGRIDIVSDEGQGSTFRLALPGGGPQASPPLASARHPTT